LYVSPFAIRLNKSRMRWAVHVARTRDVRNTVFGGKHEGKRLLGRTRSRLEDTRVYPKVSGLSRERNNYILCP